jgi:hypothetical protein
MKTRYFIALISVIALALPALGVRDGWAVAQGDVNGDQRIDVLDLQIIIARALQTAHVADKAGLGGDEHANVLDFQRALSQVQLRGHSHGVPASKPSSKGCFFAHQTRWTLDPVEQKADSGVVATVPIPRSARFDRPDRSLIPRGIERYLFILTPNAPPVCA